MTYDIVNEFSHDQNAYTQGLEIYENFLFESTGLNGKGKETQVMTRITRISESEFKKEKYGNFKFVPMLENKD